MSENADDSMKMLSLHRAERFFSYEEGQESGELYLVIGKSSGERAGFYDDVELFGSAAEGEENLNDSDKYEEAFGEGFGEPGDDELTNPIKHYIMKWAGSASSREKERRS